MDTLDIKKNTTEPKICKKFVFCIKRARYD